MADLATVKRASGAAIRATLRDLKTASENEGAHARPSGHRVLPASNVAIDNPQSSRPVVITLFHDRRVGPTLAM
jgi:hypothetical protein